MKSQKSRTKIISYIMLLILGVCSIFILLGIQHVEPSSALRQAHNNLQAGHIGEALLGYIRGYGMALDAGMRSLTAKYYGIKMRQYLERGQLDNALENCLIVAKILGRYDDEGAQKFLCLQIEESIKR
jgi:hypothetical protein